MQLSIVIVNYNVKHFVEQCLHSVYKAVEGLETEVFVVDNNSVDGSNDLVRAKFPQVTLIANKDNVGFSRANNQAIRLAKGKYVLLLNPDTVVEEDTFRKVVAFMDAHPDAGGLGVKMLDGKGNFLPESKRGLPTPAVAFYKVFGLSALFPKSKRFGKYHLGYLDKDLNHEIDVLSGAFMLMRKETLDKVGLLDETFFMYGEDIDLSYRIQKGGYKNYYFADTRIIHYKGESTKKSSVNYVRVFYKAMIIFAEKHFSTNNAKLFSTLINLAIYLRAGMALAKRLVQKVWLPILDYSFILAFLYLIKQYYEQNVKQGDGTYYDQSLINIAFPVYALVWLGAVYFNNGYDKPTQLKAFSRGTIIGSMLILVGYALLPEHYRFSRAIIILGSAAVMGYYFISRFILHFAKVKGFILNLDETKRIAIVGESEEYNRVLAILKETKIKPNTLGFINTNGETDVKDNLLGHISQLKEIIEVNRLNEVIFCAKNLSSIQIIDYMSLLVSNDIDFKIAPPESLSIIGSNSIDTAGDLYVIDFNTIIKPANKRNKRLFDIFGALSLLVLSPLLIWKQTNKLGYFTNLIQVLFAQKTLVGFNKIFSNSKEFPKLKPGVLAPCDEHKITNMEEIKKNNAIYARNYSTHLDLKIVLNQINNLGN